MGDTNKVKIAKTITGLAKLKLANIIELPCAIVGSVILELAALLRILAPILS